MPGTFGVSTNADYNYSLYCTYTTGGGETITETIGNETVYDRTSVSPTRRAMPVSFTRMGDIQSLTIYHNGGTGHVLLGVYSDATGAPSSFWE